jgi:cardiolipin synthase
MKNLNLPNLLTFGRLAVVPIFVFCLAKDHPVAALWLFVGAGVTDVVDGLLARLFHQETTLGAWLDPLADKLLVFTAFVALTAIGDVRFPLWFTILVLGRDLIIAAGIGALRLLRRPVVIDPARLSKYATFFQYLTLSVMLLYRSSGAPPAMAPYLQAVMVVCLVLALISIGQYFWRGLQILRSSG